MKKRLVPIAGLLVVIISVSVVTYRVRFDTLADGATADLVVLEKAARKLTILRSGQPLKVYRVALGRQPVGPKQFEGDGKTPEGAYVVDTRKRDSAYHRALQISYPSPADEAFAAEQARPAGSAIMIHGIRNGFGLLGPLHRVYDWTQGCIAVTDAEIEELWRAVPDGTPIELRP